MKLATIRSTMINTALKCEKRLYLQLLNKRELTSPYLLVGTCVHFGIEQYYKGIYDINNIMALFESNQPKYDFSGKIDVLKAESMIKGYLSYFMNKRARAYTPLTGNSMEIPFRIRVSNSERSIVITGKADFLDKSGWLVDWKTTSGNFKDLKTWSMESQNQIYPAGLKSKGYDIKGFRYCVFSDKDLQEFDIPFNQDRFNELGSYCLKLQEVFENEEGILENRKSCKWCEVKNLCENS